MPETTRRLDTLREHSPRFALTLERAAADAETLEIPASVASDAIIDDSWNGPVSLSMDPGAVDLTEAMARGLPVLTMHERELPIGRFLSPRIEAGRLVGIIRFSRSDEGRQIYQDCVDGILTDTSIGAAITAVREEPSHLVAIRWHPREVSLVDRGADASVGINRAAADSAAPLTGATRTMPEPTLTAADPAGSAGAHNPATGGTSTTAETQRTTNIMELARYADSRAPALGLGKLAEDYIQCGQPFESYRSEVWRRLQEVKAQEPGITAPPAQIGMSQREAQEFSIVRACNAALSGDWRKAGFELEASRAIAERIGRPPRGFFVPLEVQADIARAHLQRAETLSAGNPTYGGFLVPTDYRPDLFIEALRATAVCFAAGVRTLPGLVGNLSIPKKTGVGSFSWISEGEDAPDTDVSVAAVGMAPRTIAGGVAMTRRLLQQSSPAVEGLVRADLVEGCALAIDLAILQGDGVKAPRGIWNHPSINTQAISTDGSPTWAEMVGFETECDTDNALSGALSYITTPAVVGKLKTTPKVANQALYLMDSTGQVNGYPVRRTSQLAQHSILFGNWSQILVGFWGVLDIKPDEAKLAASGGLVLRVFQDADVAVRHAEAFCKGT